VVTHVELSLTTYTYRIIVDGLPHGQIGVIESQPYSWEITHFHVADAYQHKGHGTAALRQLFHKAHAEMIRTIEVPDSVVDGFYIKAGMKLVRVPNGYAYPALNVGEWISQHAAEGCTCDLREGNQARRVLPATDEEVEARTDRS
jgi:hypothetical protein